MGRAAGIERLFKGIEDRASVRYWFRSNGEGLFWGIVILVAQQGIANQWPERGPPHDPISECVDNEGNTGKAFAAARRR
jgi:hypothetical protein